MKPSTKNLEKRLLKAAATGDSETILALISKGANPNCSNSRIPESNITALMYACEGGHAAAVKVLLEAGADVHARDTSMARGGGGATALDYALKQFENRAGPIEIIRWLLEAGADPNSPRDNGDSPFEEAASNNALEVCLLMLEHGANPDRTNKPQRCPALAWAALNGNQQLVEALLSRGALIDGARSEDGTALIAASVRGHLHIVKLLLERCANVNPPVERGRPPLVAAAWELSGLHRQPSIDNAAQLIKLLVEAGANVNHVDERHFTALDWASMWPEHETVAEYLKQHGAKRGNELP